MNHLCQRITENFLYFQIHNGKQTLLKKVSNKVSLPDYFITIVTTTAADLETPSGHAGPNFS